MVSRHINFHVSWSGTNKVVKHHFGHRLSKTTIFSDSPLQFHVQSSTNNKGVQTENNHHTPFDSI